MDHLESDVFGEGAVGTSYQAADEGHRALSARSTRSQPPPMQYQQQQYHHAAEASFDALAAPPAPGEIDKTTSLITTAPVSRFSKPLSFHEQLELTREDRIRKRWVEQQKSWSSHKSQLAGRLGRPENELIFSSVDAFRALVEDIDLYDRTRPPRENGNPDYWPMTLRNGGARFELIGGSIFTGLWLEIKQDNARRYKGETIRHALPVDGAVARAAAAASTTATDLLSTASSLNGGNLAISGGTTLRGGHGVSAEPPGSTEALDATLQIMASGGPSEVLPKVVAAKAQEMHLVDPAITAAGMALDDAGFSTDDPGRPRTRHDRSSRAMMSRELLNIRAAALALSKDKSTAGMPLMSNSLEASKALLRSAEEAAAQAARAAALAAEEKGKNAGGFGGHPGSPPTGGSVSASSSSGYGPLSVSSSGFLQRQNADLLKARGGKGVPGVSSVGLKAVAAKDVPKALSLEDLAKLSIVAVPLVQWAKDSNRALAAAHRIASEAAITAAEKEAQGYLGAHTSRQGLVAAVSGTRPTIATLRSALTSNPAALAARLAASVGSSDAASAAGTALRLLSTMAASAAGTHPTSVNALIHSHQPHATVLRLNNTGGFAPHGVLSAQSSIKAADTLRQIALAGPLITHQKGHDGEQDSGAEESSLEEGEGGDKENAMPSFAGWVGLPPNAAAKTASSSSSGGAGSLNLPLAEAGLGVTAVTAPFIAASALGMEPVAAAAAAVSAAVGTAGVGRGSSHPMMPLSEHLSTGPHLHAQVVQDATTVPGIDVGAAIGHSGTVPPIYRKRKASTSLSSTSKIQLPSAAAAESFQADFMPVRYDGAGAAAVAAAGNKATKAGAGAWLFGSTGSNTLAPAGAAAPTQSSALGSAANAGNVRVVMTAMPGQAATARIRVANTGTTAIHFIWMRREGGAGAATSEGSSSSSSSSALLPLAPGLSNLPTGSGGPSAASAGGILLRSTATLRGNRKLYPHRGGGGAAPGGGGAIALPGTTLTTTAQAVAAAIAEGKPALVSGWRPLASELPGFSTLGDQEALQHAIEPAHNPVISLQQQPVVVGNNLLGAGAGGGPQQHPQLDDLDDDNNLAADQEQKQQQQQQYGYAEDDDQESRLTGGATSFLRNTQYQQQPPTVIQPGGLETGGFGATTGLSQSDAARPAVVGAQGTIRRRSLAGSTTASPTRGVGVTVVAAGDASSSTALATTMAASLQYQHQQAHAQRNQLNNNNRSPSPPHGGRPGLITGVLPPADSPYLRSPVNPHSPSRLAQAIATAAAATDTSIRRTGGSAEGGSGGNAGGSGGGSSNSPFSCGQAAGSILPGHTKDITIVFNPSSVGSNPSGSFSETWLLATVPRLTGGMVMTFTLSGSCVSVDDGQPRRQRLEGRIRDAATYSRMRELVNALVDSLPLPEDLEPEEVRRPKEAVLFEASNPGLFYHAHVYDGLREISEVVAECYAEQRGMALKNARERIERRKEKARQRAENRLAHEMKEKEDAATASVLSRGRGKLKSGGSTVLSGGDGGHEQQQQQQQQRGGTSHGSRSRSRRGGILSREKDPASALSGTAGPLSTLGDKPPTATAGGAAGASPANNLQSVLQAAAAAAAETEAAGLLDGDEGAGAEGEEMEQGEADGEGEGEGRNLEDTALIVASRGGAGGALGPQESRMTQGVGPVFPGPEGSSASQVLAGPDGLLEDDGNDDEEVDEIADTEALQKQDPFWDPLFPELSLLRRGIDSVANGDKELFDKLLASAAAAAGFAASSSSGDGAADGENKEEEAEEGDLGGLPASTPGSPGLGGGRIVSAQNSQLSAGLGTAMSAGGGGPPGSPGAASKASASKSQRPATGADALAAGASITSAGSAPGGQTLAKAGGRSGHEGALVAVGGPFSATSAGAIAVDAGAITRWLGVSPSALNVLKTGKWGVPAAEKSLRSSSSSSSSSSSASPSYLCSVRTLEGLIRCMRPAPETQSEKEAKARLLAEAEADIDKLRLAADEAADKAATLEMEAAAAASAAAAAAADPKAKKAAPPKGKDAGAAAQPTEAEEKAAAAAAAVQASKDASDNLERALQRVRDIKTGQPAAQRATYVAALKNNLLPRLTALAAASSVRPVERSPIYPLVRSMLDAIVSVVPVVAGGCRDAYGLQPRGEVGGSVLATQLDVLPMAAISSSSSCLSPSTSAGVPLPFLEGEALLKLVYGPRGKPASATLPVKLKLGRDGVYRSVPDEDAAEAAGLGGILARTLKRQKILEEFAAEGRTGDPPEEEDDGDDDEEDEEEEEDEDEEEAGEDAADKAKAEEEKRAKEAITESWRKYWARRRIQREKDEAAADAALATAKEHHDAAVSAHAEASAAFNVAAQQAAAAAASADPKAKGGKADPKAAATSGKAGTKGATADGSGAAAPPPTAEEVAALLSKATSAAEALARAEAESKEASVQAGKTRWRERFEWTVKRALSLGVVSLSRAIDRHSAGSVALGAGSDGDAASSSSASSEAYRLSYARQKFLLADKASVVGEHGAMDPVQAAASSLQRLRSKAVFSRRRVPLHLLVSHREIGLLLTTLFGAAASAAGASSGGSFQGSLMSKVASAAGLALGHQQQQQQQAVPLLNPSALMPLGPLVRRPYLQAASGSLPFVFFTLPLPLIATVRTDYSSLPFAVLASAASALQSNNSSDTSVHPAMRALRAHQAYHQSVSTIKQLAGSGVGLVVLAGVHGVVPPPSGSFSSSSFEGTATPSWPPVTGSADTAAIEAGGPAPVSTSKLLALAAETKDAEQGDESAEEAEQGGAGKGKATKALQGPPLPLPRVRIVPPPPIPGLLSGSEGVVLCPAPLAPPQALAGGEAMLPPQVQPQQGGGEDGHIAKVAFRAPQQFFTGSFAPLAAALNIDSSSPVLFMPSPFLLDAERGAASLIVCSEGRTTAIPVDAYDHVDSSSPAVATVKAALALADAEGALESNDTAAFLRILAALHRAANHASAAAEPSAADSEDDDDDEEEEGQAGQEAKAKRTSPAFASRHSHFAPFVVLFENLNAPATSAVAGTAFSRRSALVTGSVAHLPFSPLSASSALGSSAAIGSDSSKGENRAVLPLSHSNRVAFGLAPFASEEEGSEGGHNKRAASSSSSNAVLAFRPPYAQRALLHGYGDADERSVSCWSTRHVCSWLWALCPSIADKERWTTYVRSAAQSKINGEALIRIASLAAGVDAFGILSGSSDSGAGGDFVSRAKNTLGHEAASSSSSSSSEGSSGLCCNVAAEALVRLLTIPAAFPAAPKPPAVEPATAADKTAADGDASAVAAGSPVPTSTAPATGSDDAAGSKPPSRAGPGGGKSASKPGTPAASAPGSVLRGGAGSGSVVSTSSSNNKLAVAAGPSANQALVSVAPAKPLPPAVPAVDLSRPIPAGAAPTAEHLSILISALRILYHREVSEQSASKSRAAVSGSGAHVAVGSSGGKVFDETAEEQQQEAGEEDGGGEFAPPAAFGSYDALSFARSLVCKQAAVRGLLSSLSHLFIFDGPSDVAEPTILDGRGGVLSLAPVAIAAHLPLASAAEMLYHHPLLATAASHSLATVAAAGYALPANLGGYQIPPAAAAATASGGSAPASRSSSRGNGGLRSNSTGGGNGASGALSGLAASGAGGSSGSSLAPVARIHASWFRPQARTMLAAAAAGGASEAPRTRLLGSFASSSLTPLSRMLLPAGAPQTSAAGSKNIAILGGGAADLNAKAKAFENLINSVAGPSGASSGGGFFHRIALAGPLGVAWLAHVALRAEASKAFVATNAVAAGGDGSSSLHHHEPGITVKLKPAQARTLEAVDCALVLRRLQVVLSNGTNLAAAAKTLEAAAHAEKDKQAQEAAAAAASAADPKAKAGGKADAGGKKGGKDAAPDADAAAAAAAAQAEKEKLQASTEIANASLERLSGLVNLPHLTPAAVMWLFLQVVGSSSYGGWETVALPLRRCAAEAKRRGIKIMAPSDLVLATKAFEPSSCNPTSVPAQAGNGDNALARIIRRSWFKRLPGADETEEAANGNLAAGEDQGGQGGWLTAGVLNGRHRHPRAEVLPRSDGGASASASASAQAAAPLKEGDPARLEDDTALLPPALLDRLTKRVNRADGLPASSAYREWKRARMQSQLSLSLGAPSAGSGAGKANANSAELISFGEEFLVSQQAEKRRRIANHQALDEEDEEDDEDEDENNRPDADYDSEDEEEMRALARRNRSRVVKGAIAAALASHHSACREACEQLRKASKANDLPVGSCATGFGKGAFAGRVLKANANGTFRGTDSTSAQVPPNALFAQAEPFFVCPDSEPASCEWEVEWTTQTIAVPAARSTKHREEDDNHQGEKTALQALAAALPGLLPLVNSMLLPSHILPGPHHLPSIIDVGAGFTDRLTEAVSTSSAILLCGPLGVIETADGAGATTEVLKAAMQAFTSSSSSSSAHGSKGGKGGPVSVVVAGGALSAFAARTVGKDVPSSSSSPSSFTIGGQGASALLCSSDGGGFVLSAIQDRVKDKKGTQKAAAVATGSQSQRHQHHQHPQAHHQGPGGVVIDGVRMKVEEVEPMRAT